MSKVVAKYQLRVPSILMAGEEVLRLDPIKVATHIGEVVIYPPGSQGRKPESYVEPKQGHAIGEIRWDFGKRDSPLWQADTLWVDIKTDMTRVSSWEEIHGKLDKEMREFVSRLLRLVRRKLPEAPMALPAHLPFSVNLEWGRQPPGHYPVASTVGYHIKVVPPGAGINKERWRELQQEMSSGVDTELYEDFVADARVALEEDDLNRATLYSAIACEIFVKEYTEKAAKEASISPKFWEYLKSRQPRVLDYYDSILHLVKGHSLRKENPTIYKLLDQLYEARNKIMHEGKLPPSWSKVKVGQLREDIRRVEQVISWVCGL
jgi:hypothetical protein